LRLIIGSLMLFLFSSRSRHTRFSRDWSSDVCSSDLPGELLRGAEREVAAGQLLLVGLLREVLEVHHQVVRRAPVAGPREARTARSEERRVGKECRARRDGREVVKIV